jgi:orotidine-5'-phosphate decarboxylase
VTAPLAVALDTTDLDVAAGWAAAAGPYVSTVKVGLELYLRHGAAAVTRAREASGGRAVFLDLKLHDIPNTMASALRSLSRQPISLTTVHVAAGTEALRACVETAAAVEGKGIGLLGVTRLTSLPPADPLRPWDDVLSLARRGADAGLYGWIAPPEAAPHLRSAFGSGPALVTPGIRLPQQERQDQVSVGTPEGALKGGADWIVVGRPITRAPDPREAAREFVRRLAQAGARD